MCACGWFFGFVFFVFWFFFLQKASCPFWLLYDGQKDQKNVFHIFSLFTFQIPERYAPTIVQKSQPLSKLTHCEETCTFQVSYSHEKPIHQASQTISTVDAEAWLPNLELSAGIRHCTKQASPQRSSEEHNFPACLRRKSWSGYNTVQATPLPFDSSYEQGSPRLVHAEAPTII